MSLDGIEYHIENLRMVKNYAKLLRQRDFYGMMVDITLDQHEKLLKAYVEKDKEVPERARKMLLHILREQREEELHYTKEDLDSGLQYREPDGCRKGIGKITDHNQGRCTGIHTFSAKHSYSVSGRTI